MNQRINRPYNVSFFISLLFFTGCVTTTPVRTQIKSNDAEIVSETNKGLEHQKRPEVTKTEGKKHIKQAKALKTLEQNTRADLSSNREDEKAKREIIASDFPDKTNQLSSNEELLDSALDYCQASSDFWEQGDLDNAILALDKAYSLTLKVNGDAGAELLQQKDDIRFTISKRVIEVYSSRFTVANGSHKAIPLEMNKHVERALKLFKGRERKFFLEAYKRSGRYRPAIVKALKDAGLPEELSWLPLIESGFKVRALSRARALGMWQFIASTGYKYGLKRDTWIDERMNPEKSTMAAIAYLTQLHNIFGDWTTALAAYNCGERRVLNRINDQKINYLDNFWDLYKRLPRETAFYVPKFLAVLHIVNNPEAHGIKLPQPEGELEYEEVTINKQLHLETIAKHLKVDYSELKALNPELRRNLTPKTAYSLNVPMGKGEILLAELKDIPVYRPPVPRYVIHRVRSGESLSVIAKRYKTSVRAITSMNGLRNKNFLRIGQKLKIPSKEGYASDTERASYTSKSKGKLEKYRVKNGDSLWKIAQRYNTTVKIIRTLNRLPSSRLSIGQLLYLPTGKSITEPGKTKKYKVRKGDSPYLIAKRHRMNLHEFLKLNDLTPKSMIFPGQLVQVMID